MKPPKEMPMHQSKRKSMPSSMMPDQDEPAMPMGQIAGNTDMAVVPSKGVSANVSDSKNVEDTIAGFEQPVNQSTYKEVAGSAHSQVQVSPVTSDKGKAPF